MLKSVLSVRLVTTMPKALYIACFSATKNDSMPIWTELRSIICLWEEVDLKDSKFPTEEFVEKIFYLFIFSKKLQNHSRQLRNKKYFFFSSVSYLWWFWMSKLLLITQKMKLGFWNQLQIVWTDQKILKLIGYISFIVRLCLKFSQWSWVMVRETLNLKAVYISEKYFPSW